MGLRTEHGRDNLSDWLLLAVKNVVDRLDPSRFADLYRLASNARQTIMGSASEWKPFERLLLDAGIDRSNRDHVTALMLELMPKILKQEKDARDAAVAKAHERYAKMGLRLTPWSRDGRFAVKISKESARSIKAGAERFASALERLAKK